MCTHIRHKKIVHSTTRMSSSSIFGCQYSIFFLNFPIYEGLNFYRNIQLISNTTWDTEISEYQIQSLQNNKTSMNTAYVEPWLMAIIQTSLHYSSQDAKIKYFNFSDAQYYTLTVYNR